jgi:RsiW-degrading membrane proteinase PrsW (M82 family)
MVSANVQRFLDTWGTVPLASSQITVRTIALGVGAVVLALSTILNSGTQAIVALALNAASVAAMVLITKATRTVSMRVLVFCFLIGAAMMGLALAFGNAIAVSMVTDPTTGKFDSPFRSFLLPPIEDICRFLPVLFLVLLGRNFTTKTMGACDVALIGISTGAGFAFVEDACVHATTGWNNPFFWLPATVFVNGHLVAGHALWSALAGCTLGLGLLLQHKKALALPLMASGFVWAAVDHVAMDYSIAHTDVASNILTVLSANGFVTILLFVACLAAALAFDLFIIFRSTPNYPEFRLFSRNDRSESISMVWQFVLDRRRFAFALYRHNAEPESEQLCLVSSILAQSLINYRHGAKVKPGAAPLYVEAKAKLPPPAPAPAPSPAKPQTQMHQPPEEFQQAWGRTHPDDMSTEDRLKEAARRAISRNVDNSDRTLSLDLNSTATPAPSSYGEEVMREIKLPSQYILLSRISEGGMGIIFRAKHRHTGAKLAIKVLHPHIAKVAVNVLRFEQEAKAACAMNHPNLVVVHDFGITADSIPYLVMDLIEGVSLQKFVRSQGPLSVKRFVDLFTQTADAIHHAHRRGVIHRDIKPSNLLLTTDDKGNDMIRIVDFGIAKLTTEGPRTQDLTGTGDLVGSPLYMSPEQCLGNQLDVRSDLYSLGCTMYFALTGQEPFLGKNAVQTIFKHLHDMPVRPSEIQPGVPEQVELVIFKLIQKDPGQRFSSADEVKAALQHIREMGVLSG